jgi:hypothetical protein
METRREGGLLAWQWSLYPDGHRDRRNLLVHVLTVPVFMLGSCAVALAPFVNGWLGLGGAIGMTTAMALQGRTHGLEATPPVPFRGPLDVLARIFVEQWITFPRYVLCGGLGRAWRTASRTKQGS